MEYYNKNWNGCNGCKGYIYNLFTFSNITIYIICIFTFYINLILNLHFIETCLFLIYLNVKGNKIQAIVKKSLMEIKSF